MLYTKKIIIFLIVIIMITFLIECSNDKDNDDIEWELVWQDNFDGIAGESPDSTKWNYTDRKIFLWMVRVIL